MTRPEGALPEFNPLRFPPCACPRCRGGESVPDADGDAGEDSPLLLRLRARVTEENGLRGAIRRAMG